MSVTKEAQPAALTPDEFILDCGNTMLKTVEVSSQEAGNKSEIEITIQAIQSGVSDIIVASGYDPYEDADNAEVCVFTGRGLKDTDGQIVYVTPKNPCPRQIPLRQGQGFLVSVIPQHLPCSSFRLLRLFA